MGIFQKIRKLWNVIVTDWKTKYRLVFSNEDTNEQRWEVKNITIKKTVVIGIIAVAVIGFLTSLLIALTPLRVYIPGYTSQREYKLYKQAVSKIDSLEKTISNNQAYIDHFTAMAEGQVPTMEDMDNNAASTPDVHNTSRDTTRLKKTREIIEEAEMILGRVQKENTNSTPTLDQAKISNLSIYPPALGAVSSLFNPEKKHYGVDIQGTKNSAVSCVADGVVISSNYSDNDGYVIIVQHPGNLISVYKRNASLLKRVGDRVKAGSPIAIMGSTGNIDGKSIHLHFELWYNGFPINPLNYLVIQ